MSAVYLAGPINGCTDTEALDWRENITGRLERLGHTVLSPMARDYRGRENTNVSVIVSGDKSDIDSSEIIIAYCPEPSVGTSMEVLYAWERGRRIIVVLPPGAPVSPWLEYHAHVVVATVEDATKYIRRQL